MQKSLFLFRTKILSVFNLNGLLLLLTKADLRAWYANSFLRVSKKVFFSSCCEFGTTAQVVTSWIDVVHHHRFLLPSDIFKLERSGWKNPNKCIHLSAIIGRQAARIFIAKNHLRSLLSSPFHLSKVERPRSEGPWKRNVSIYIL